VIKLRKYGAVIQVITARSFAGRAVYRTAAYWVDGLLIDTGCPAAAKELLQAVAELRLDLIVNTHSHEDHFGANGALQTSRVSCIRAHPLALGVLRDPRQERRQLYRRLFWGEPEPCRPEPIDDWLQVGQHTFKVLETPGHSPDHISLFEPEQGWLFTGDAFIGGRDRSARPDYDVYAAIESLHTLAGLDARVLFSGSGTVRDNPGHALREKIAYLQGLGDEVLRLAAEGLSTKAISRRLFGGEERIFYLTGGHFRGSHLVNAFLQTPDRRPASGRAGQALSCDG